jgi:hypothetical protein
LFVATWLFACHVVASALLHQANAKQELMPQQRNAKQQHMQERGKGKANRNVHTEFAPKCHSCANV